MKLLHRPFRMAMATVVAAFLAAGCNQRAGSSGQAPRTRGIVLVLIDALRADHLGAYGYHRATSPNIDALAAESTLFANAVTTAPWTLPAMGSLWTSLYPSVHGATRRSNEMAWMKNRAKFRPASILAPDRTTLAEVLRANGYRTAAFVDGAYPGSVFGFAQGFDLFVEDDLYGARLNVEGFLDWLDREQPERFLAYLHLVDVHSPYTPPGIPNELSGSARRILDEERRQYATIDFDPGYRGAVNGSWESLAALRRANPAPNTRDVAHVIALYDRGIAYADRWVGALVAGLKQRQLFDEIVLIVTADHGEEFFEHGGLEHGVGFYEEVMRIPLVIHVPAEGNGITVHEQVGLIDLMPTVLDLASIEPPTGLQGLSLRPLLHGSALPERFLFGEADQAGNQKAMRSNLFKYIRKGTKPQLYDLRVDPGETTNLCATASPDCDAFAGMLQEWEQESADRARAFPTAPAAAVDERTRERLRALGYEE